MARSSASQWEGPIRAARLVAVTAAAAGGAALVLWVLLRLLELDPQFQAPPGAVSGLILVVRVSFPILLLAGAARAVAIATRADIARSQMIAWAGFGLLGLWVLANFEMFRIVAILLGAVLEGLDYTAALAQGTLVQQAPLFPLLAFTGGLLSVAGIDSIPVPGGMSRLLTPGQLLVVPVFLAAIGLGSLALPGAKTFRAGFAVACVGVALWLLAVGPLSATTRGSVGLQGFYVVSLLVGAGMLLVYSELRAWSMRDNSACAALPAPPHGLLVLVLVLFAVPAYADLHNRHRIHNAVAVSEIVPHRLPGAPLMAHSMHRNPVLERWAPALIS